MADALQVHVSTLSGEEVSAVAMPRTAIAAQLKQRLAEEDEARTPASRLCLLLGDQVVSDSDVLSDLVPVGSPSKLALHLVRKRRKVELLPDPVELLPNPQGGEEHELLVKMLLIGDGKVGKTSVLERFVRHRFETAAAHETIGVDFRVVNVLSETMGVDFRAVSVLVDDLTRVKLQIWDTAGSERFRTVTRAYFRGANGVLAVFDVTVRDSFEHLSKHLDDIGKHCPPEVLVSIVGNKADLLDRQEVSEEEAAAFAAQRGLAYYGVSAKTGANTEAPFHDLCGALADRTQRAG